MIELKPCPFCGSHAVRLQFRQALDHKNRYGRYDAAMYCAKCYAYGPRVKSEDAAMPAVDHRNEMPSENFRLVMRREAVKKWNGYKEYGRSEERPPLFEEG